MLEPTARPWYHIRMLKPKDVRELLETIDANVEDESERNKLKYWMLYSWWLLWVLIAIAGIAAAVSVIAGIVSAWILT